MSTHAPYGNRTVRAARLSALLACLALPAPALAQQPDAPDTSTQSTTQPTDFKGWVALANQRYGDEDFTGAIAAFKEAYALNPKPAILYNIGRIYEKTGDFENALVYYERFINAPDVDIGPRQDALTRLKTLREILEMRAEKKEPAENPSPTAETAPPVDEIPPPADTAITEETTRGSRALPITLLAVGGTALIGGGVFAGLAASSNRAREDAATLNELEDANETGATRALVADTLFITGGALAVLGVVFLVTSDSPSDTESTATIAPMLGPDRVGGGFTFTF